MYKHVKISMMISTRWGATGDHGLRIQDPEKQPPAGGPRGTTRWGATRDHGLWIQDPGLHPPALEALCRTLRKISNIGPIEVSQALVKCSRRETYDFKAMFRVPGPGEA